MPLFKPTFFFQGVLEITPELLKEQNIKGLVLDVDNTLAFAGDPTPFQGVLDWMSALRENGISLMVLSNNTMKRVQSFAAGLKVEAISMACKPLPIGFWRAARQMKLPASQVAVVGDQLFTDVWGAKLAGMKTILVAPARMETSWSFRVKRKMEKRLLQKYRMMK